MSRENHIFSSRVFAFWLHFGAVFILSFEPQAAKGTTSPGMRLDLTCATRLSGAGYQPLTSATPGIRLAIAKRQENLRQEFELRAGGGQLPVPVLFKGALVVPITIGSQMFVREAKVDSKWPTEDIYEVVSKSGKTRLRAALVETSHKRLFYRHPYLGVDIRIVEVTQGDGSGLLSLFVWALKYPGLEKLGIKSEIKDDKLYLHLPSEVDINTLVHRAYAEAGRPDKRVFDVVFEDNVEFIDASNPAALAEGRNLYSRGERYGHDLGHRLLYQEAIPDPILDLISYHVKFYQERVQDTSLPPQIRDYFAAQLGIVRSAFESLQVPRFGPIELPQQILDVFEVSLSAHLHYVEDYIVPRLFEERRDVARERMNLYFANEVRRNPSLFTSRVDPPQRQYYSDRFRDNLGILLGVQASEIVNPFTN